jgi:hypothetical protein
METRIMNFKSLLTLSYFTDDYYLDNWDTLTHGQSEDVRMICSHMTRREKKQAINMASTYGSIMGIAIPFVAISGFVLFMTYPLLCIPFGIACIAFFVAATRYIKRYQREFLCSTEWAREQGYRPESIQLFRR